jgi:hypothetical protein
VRSEVKDFHNAYSTIKMVDDTHLNAVAGREVSSP